MELNKNKEIFCKSWGVSVKRSRKSNGSHQYFVKQSSKTFLIVEWWKCKKSNGIPANKYLVKVEVFH